MKRFLLSLWRALNICKFDLTPREWLMTGWANLVLLVNMERPAIVEMVVGAWEICYGFWFMLPLDAFGAAPLVYHWMHSLMPQTAWGVVLFTVGTCQLCCLAWPDPKARHWAARASQFMWAFLFFGWFLAGACYVWHGFTAEHVLRPGLFVSAFGVLCCFWWGLATWVLYRLAPVPSISVSRTRIADDHTITYVKTTP